MKEKSKAYLDLLIQRYPELQPCYESIVQATEALVSSYKSGGKLLICGNGGSAADSEHIVGELMKGFILSRHIATDLSHELCDVYPDDGEHLSMNLQYGLPAISLVSQTALSTAFSNDQAPDVVFAQEVLGYGKLGDALLGISTSGNSKNVVYAMEVAKTIGLHTIGLTGMKESKISKIADITIKATETETFKIQEKHLPIYHAICLALENEFYGA